MDIFAPTYYKKFECIADRCRHNCCIGWEIDIDDITLESYKTKSDIMENILMQGTPHFKQCSNGRCAFLNERNLCDIISAYGEDSLCQICRDHPRFRNFFDSRTEIGLGLTCEAATKLVLNNDFLLEKIGENAERSFGSDDEQEFFEFRDGVFKRTPESLKFTLPDIKVNELAEVFKGLERLDTAWDDLLETLKDRNENLADIELSNPPHAKRLLDYFVFRHLHEYGLEFCVLCTYFVMSFNGDIYEIARMFSSEIEYSDQNIEAIIEQVLE